MPTVPYTSKSVISRKKDRIFRDRNEIVRLAEKSKVIMEFTTLNDNFINQMNDKNREVNEKNMNEKRLENRPPGDKYPKREADKQFKEKLINLC
ncbi:unnamed protein product [Rhizophagus irregularis]|nr:unnamed protein product [Rhizophagus irregularis]